MKNLLVNMNLRRRVTMQADIEQLMKRFLRNMQRLFEVINE